MKRVQFLFLTSFVLGLLASGCAPVKMDLEYFRFQCKSSGAYSQKADRLCSTANKLQMCDDFSNELSADFANRQECEQKVADLYRKYLQKVSQTYCPAYTGNARIFGLRYCQYNYSAEGKIVHPDPEKSTE